MENIWDTYTACSLDGVHIVIQRRDGKPITAEWDVLQQIKNEMVGEDAFAIEIYPSSSDLVNETNRRHLWVVSDALIADFNIKRR